MHLIESRVEFLPQEPGIEGVYKAIEKAGRTCYKSEDKITEDSAKGFVDRMIKSGHGAMLEHGTVYLQCKIYLNAKDDTPLSKYKNNKYSKCSEYYFPGNASRGTYVVTNYRVLIENNWLDDLKYLCDPTEFHEKRFTMRFTCSRAIAQELTRHRKFSFSMESQRYINYSKEKHGGELTIIRPDRSAWERTETSNGDAYWAMLRLLDDIELVYMEAIKEGVKPEIARDVLPNATKTELIMTGFSSDWKRLLRLRLFEETGKVHPDMKVLMEKLKAEAEKHGIWEDIMSKPSKFE